jgi:DNA polymerase III subunit gamma/tau
MSYLALARKWRPRTFSQLVGQEHLKKVLINSLNQQRLHHAYLFTGTRGIGKTSVARLLAKALNCLQGISAEPCLQCDACVAIEQGCFIDLIEIDSALRTGVEGTRELLENVQYRPTNGRFKIYIIDEVHMLSQYSFNALLKTLEEPPAHVKFLLATTEPQKLPVTILSRCLQFSLKHLPVELISQRLQHILNDEQLPYEAEAVAVLAKAAKGSMRDALSLLDQAIASADSKLHTQEVRAILGYTQQDYAIQLLQALASLDAQQLIHISRQIASEGGHFHYVLDELLDYLHQITVNQSLPGDNPLISSNPEIKAMTKQFTPEDIQLFYQIGIKGIEDLHLAPTLAIGFEMTLLRMLTFRPAPKVDTPPLAYEMINKQSVSPIGHTQSLVMENPRLPKEPYKQKSLLPPNHNENDWGCTVTQLKLTGLALSALENTQFVGKSGHEISLRITKGHQSLFTPTLTKRIEQALEAYYKEPIKLVVTSAESIQASPAQQKQTAQNLRQQDAESKLLNDPFFQRLRQEFSAELAENSIVPAQGEL